MAITSHDRPSERRGVTLPGLREMWASLAISMMWLAVLFDSVFGPDFVSANTTSTTKIPSGIVVALFAVFGTRAVARFAFRRED